jgi:Cys-rich repeat protein
LSDTDCATGQKCDTASLTCYKPGSKQQCQTCTANSDCATGHKCITVSFGNNRSERVCAKDCANDRQCPQGFACGSSSGPRLSGSCWPTYGNRFYQFNGVKSCKGCIM